MPSRLIMSFSTRGSNRNCRQEAGGAALRRVANIPPMDSRAYVSRGFPFPVFSGGWLLLILLVLEWLLGRAYSRAAVVAAPRITLVVFADRPMAGEEWSALSVALHQGFQMLSAETHLSLAEFEVLRGDTIMPGQQFDEVISIYVHGECRLFPRPGKQTVEGALGWVLRDHGEIRPFIHVDCSRIAEMLAGHVLGSNQEKRDAMLAEAISRVILHEWMHVATQSPVHTRDGIEKSSFGVNDLVRKEPKMSAPASHGK